MARELIDLPTENLPAPERGELPPPLPLRRMLGPGVILLGLSIGSGEFVMWPRLTAEFGFAVFWAAMVGVTIQFFLNMEIERYTLATGESAVTGFFRLSWWSLPVFLLCGTVPWIWPGWATGSATLLSWELGTPDLATTYAVVGLILCGVTLSIGPVVYRTVEVLQIGLVLIIFTLAVGLVFLVVTGDSVAALFEGAMSFGHIPENIELPLLLGALAFAGAGGTGNLAQSNYIKDKGYGMGQYIGRITSPLTGREEATNEVGTVFDGSDESVARWRVWWRRANVEHGLSFLLLCVLSLAMFCLLTHSLLGEPEPGREVGEGLAFIGQGADQLEARFGGFAKHLFLWTGIVVLLTTEIGILDAITRVVVDLLAVGWFRKSKYWTQARTYSLVLWSLITFGVFVLLIGIDEPMTLLVLSASLNAVVMFIYSGMLLWLGLRVYRSPLRPSIPRLVFLVGSMLFFGYFSWLTVADKLSS